MRPLSILSTASSLPAYNPPLYADLPNQPKTPPASIYSPESNVSTPVLDRTRSVCSPLGRDDEEEDESEGERRTGLPSELDYLIAQTVQLLESTTECLRAGLEAREQLKRFQALDSLVDRCV